MIASPSGTKTVHRDYCWLSQTADTGDRDELYELWKFRISGTLLDESWSDPVSNTSTSLPDTEVVTQLFSDKRRRSVCWYMTENPFAKSSTTKAESLSRELDMIRSLVQEGKVAKARTLLRELRGKFNDDPDVMAWTKILSLPRILSQDRLGTASGLRKNYEWIENNGHDYQGKWVALRDGRLIGADVSRIALHNSLNHELRGITFAKL